MVCYDLQSLKESHKSLKTVVCKLLANTSIQSTEPKGGGRLKSKDGDYCLLHRYEIGGLLGLLQATCNDGRNLVPKIWGGNSRFRSK